jgi:hypothetical protein
MDLNPRQIKNPQDLNKKDGLLKRTSQLFNFQIFLEEVPGKSILSSEIKGKISSIQNPDRINNKGGKIHVHGHLDKRC